MTYKVSCWGESKTSEKCQQTAKEWECYSNEHINCWENIKVK